MTILLCLPRPNQINSSRIRYSWQLHLVSTFNAFSHRLRVYNPGGMPALKVCVSTIFSAYSMYSSTTKFLAVFHILHGNGDHRSQCMGSGTIPTLVILFALGHPRVRMYRRVDERALRRAKPATPPPTVDMSAEGMLAGRTEERNAGGCIA
jgi:hypothetical protein